MRGSLPLTRKFSLWEEFFKMGPKVERWLRDVRRNRRRRTDGEKRKKKNEEMMKKKREEQKDR